MSVMAPSNPRWRNSSATLFPAAPAPTIATERGAAVPGRALRRTLSGFARFAVTNTWPARCTVS